MSGQKLTTKEMMEEGLRILKEEPAVLVRPYLPKEEQPVVKADKLGIIKAARPEVEVSVLALHRGDGITEVLDQPTTILSKAIEQVEQMGNYKVLMALVDLDKTKPKEERLYTFTDVESKKLREVIYKGIEKEV